MAFFQGRGKAGATGASLAHGPGRRYLEGAAQAPAASLDESVDRLRFTAMPHLLPEMCRVFLVVKSRNSSFSVTVATKCAQMIARNISFFC